jgi:predicted nucleotidyltransferase
LDAGGFRLIKKKKALQSFLGRLSKDIIALYGDRHVSSLIYGGIVLGEFSPEFSDIDLLVVLEHVTEAEVMAWAEAREHWCQHPFGEKVWAHLLPAVNLQGGNSPGWTISKKGIQPFIGFPLDDMELHTLLHHGKALAGQDLRSSLPRIPSNYSVRGLQRFCNILTRYLHMSPLQPMRLMPYPSEDDLSLLLTFPRHLYNLKTGEITTKGQSARWYAREKGPFAKELLVVADYRQQPQEHKVKEVWKAIDCTPQLLVHFWQSYFKELDINVAIPHPTMLPMEVYYGETFYKIREGLQQLQTGQQSIR